MTATAVPTPALDKLHSVWSQSQAVGEFLDWLTNERGYCIAEHDDRHDRPFPSMRSIPSLLAEYYGIDEEACEDERRAILDAMRTENEARP